MRFRCLFEVKDDLHDYAEAIRARVNEVFTAPAISTMGFGNFTGWVTARSGNLQAEIIHVPAFEVLPLHSHPNVDSIDLYVAGDVDLTISGVRIAHGYPRARRMRLLRELGLRIARDALHGGQALEQGFTFVSCQRWLVAPAHIGLDWRGPPSTSQHARLLEALGRVS
jgi:hypothetical protein